VAIPVAFIARHSGHHQITPSLGLNLTPAVAGIWHSITEPRVAAARQLSVGMAALAAAVNVPFGLPTA